VVRPGDLQLSGGWLPNGERTLKVRAAVLERVGAPLEVTELDLAPPAEGEVLVRVGASGVCHSDLNAIDGTADTPCPTVLGHEGAGVIEAVGPGVALAPGTHVVLSWLPACGECGECRRELPHLCRSAWTGMATGGLLDGTPRLSRNGEPVFH
jgi:S-(hydroxymethyl)glutathione dehydrogenase/alcohol dehydrogenase